MLNQFKIIILALTVLIIVIFTTLYSFNIGVKIVQKYTPLIDAAMEIKLEATTAHLWFEEVLSGDRKDDIDLSKRKIKNAIWYAEAMINGGSNEEGVFLPLDNKELEAKIYIVLEKLHEFEKVTEIRHRHVHAGDEGDEDDKRYDKIFYEFIQVADEVETKLQKIILEELEAYNQIFYFILISEILLIIGASFVFYRYEKERSQKQGIYIQQARLASMGEMIANVAHQWRQPLNALGLVLQKISVLHSRGKLDTQKLNENVDKSMGLINGMSDTIDDFRDFFNPNKSKETFLIRDAIDKAYIIVEPIFVSNSIKYELKINDTQLSIDTYKNELSQVIVNLLNNAHDALVENKVISPTVTIRVEGSDDMIYILVCDNAGGIADSVLPNIFNPYFSTKDEKNGTGLGLYMSKMIIEDHMQGRLDASNVNGGACFSIKIRSI